MVKKENPMKQVLLDKVTVNLGVGQPGDELEKATKIIEIITGTKVVKTKCKVRQPTWGLRPGLNIGIKATLRGEKAREFLEKALTAKDKTLNKKCFDRRGNFGFGIKEHIDMPNVRYDPKLGIVGFDVLVTLKRRGYRVKRRKIGKAKVGNNQVLSANDAIKFVQGEYGVVVE